MTSFFAILWNRLEKIFDPQILSGIIIDGMMNLFVAVAIMMVFFLVWFLTRWVLRLTLRRKIDETSFSFVETTVKAFLFVIAAISALDSAGINTSALLTSLGIAGLTIGFAARDALSNLISGILIFIDRPFLLGDLVQIEGTYGKVSRITMRSTRVVTPEGLMLAVPNTEIINKTVASYTNFPHLRIDVGVTVGVGENIEKVRQLLMEVAKSDPSMMSEPAPRVVVTGLNDYNIAMELQVWLDDERRHVEKRFELREKIFNVLTRAGVDMPFETLQLQPVEVRMAEQKEAWPTGR